MLIQANEKVETVESVSNTPMEVYRALQAKNGIARTGGQLVELNREKLAYIEARIHF